MHPFGTTIKQVQLRIPNRTASGNVDYTTSVTSETDYCSEQETSRDEHCFTNAWPSHSPSTPSTCCTSLFQSSGILGDQSDFGQIVLGVRLPLSCIGGSDLFRNPPTNVAHLKHPPQTTTKTDSPLSDFSQNELRIHDSGNETGSYVVTPDGTYPNNLTVDEATKDSYSRLSPSAKFPGWDVITDDEEVDDDNTDESENKNELPETAGLTSSKRKSTVIIKVESSSSLSSTNAQPNENLINPEDENAPRSDNAKLPSVSCPTVKKSPRKSLSVMFSQITSNLGSNSTQSDRTISRELTEDVSSPQSRPSLLDGTQLLRDKRGNSTIIQLSSHLPKNMNNDLYFGKSTPRTLGTDERNSKTGDLFSMGRQSTTLGNSFSHNAEPQENRSFVRELICCASRHSMNGEQYSNLIENHRLARLVTIAAVITIVGLIFAYIIRSVIEHPTLSTGQLTTVLPTVGTELSSQNK